MPQPSDGPLNLRVLHPNEATDPRYARNPEWVDIPDSHDGARIIARSNVWGVLLPRAAQEQPHQIFTIPYFTDRIELKFFHQSLIGSAYLKNADPPSGVGARPLAVPYDPISNADRK